MNTKFEITKTVLTLSNLPISDSRIENTIFTWFSNPRTKEKGGMRLTEQGFNSLKTVFKFYDIKFQNPIKFTNKFTIWLDKHFQYPFYITSKNICVFDERSAVQLIVFSGDIQKYYRANIRFAEKQQDSNQKETSLTQE